jgi:hypothetical protein
MIPIIITILMLLSIFHIIVVVVVIIDIPIVGKKGVHRSVRQHDPTWNRS